MRSRDMTYTDITIVLDRSGSMECIAEDVVGGLNTFITTQKQVAGEARFSLVQFDNEYEVVHFNVPMADVPLLTPSDFVPRGSTALLDAIGRTILDVDRRVAQMAECERPARIIVVVQTDGLENVSREFTRDRIFQMIRQREQPGADALPAGGAGGAGMRAVAPAWEFVFLAANQDAIAEGAHLGFMAGKSVNFDAEAGSVLAMQQVVAEKVAQVRLGLSDMHYTLDQRARTRGKKVE